MTPETKFPPQDAALVPTSEGELRQVPVAWAALEDAFENNAPEVHSYLHLESGEVIRVVDGVADPALHGRIASDPNYLRVDPVSSREQYRWMERFIATVDEPNLRAKLVQSIDGKGAFRRFKDVLMNYATERELWFTFRSERLRGCMEAWLAAHKLEAVARPQWETPVGAAAEVDESQAEVDRVRAARGQIADANRSRLHDLVDAVASRDLEMAIAFLEFLRERRHTPKSRVRTDDVALRRESSAEPEDGVLLPDDD